MCKTFSRHCKYIPKTVYLLADFVTFLKCTKSKNAILFDILRVAKWKPKIKMWGWVSNKDIIENKGRGVP